jgi:hypothetical protein
MTCRPVRCPITAASSNGMNAWFRQSPHLIFGSSHTPRTNLLRHAGAYPLFPVLALTNRVGKMSSRPRNRERKSRIFSAGVPGARTSAGFGSCTWISGSTSSAESSARRAVSRRLDSACWAVSVARRDSSCAIARRSASRSRSRVELRPLTSCLRSASSCMSFLGIRGIPLSLEVVPDRRYVTEAFARTLGS